VDGYPGQPAGLSLLNGRINSAQLKMRPAFVAADSATPTLAVVPDPNWEAVLVWEGGRIAVDGFNRKLGLVRNCGRGDKPVHDHTCRYADDVVYYPPGSRFAAGVAEGARYALGGTGLLRALAPGQKPGESEGVLVASSGSARVAQIEAQIASGKPARVAVDTPLFSHYGKRVSAGNAGPSLMMDGQPVRQDAQEGWAMGAIDDKAHKLLMHDWINRRNPRTAAGVRADGTILLVAVDGHRHAASVGLTIEETRQLMGYLGARDAINLDGGGSTTMAVCGRLVNQPSDTTGERAVGDALVFIPAQR
ncbi:MAG TPA: phosphodiester glycosidase family protein, partial [Burkholderiaceae bacterium]